MKNKKKNSIILGDCLEVLKTFPDKSIDLVITDLPYQATQNPWDILIPLELLWEQYKRIAKGALIFTATQPFAAQLIISNLAWFRYDLIWRKNKSTGFLNAKKMPLRKHESILVFYEKLPVYNPQKTVGHKPVNFYTKHTSDGSNYGKTKVGVSGGGATDRYPVSVIDIPVVNNDSEEKYHPCQKPVELGRYLIKTYSSEGDLVLDNACGSGSFLVAAALEKRYYIGIEKNENFFLIAKSRLDIL